MLHLAKLSLVFAFLGGIVACGAESTPNGNRSESDGGAAAGTSGSGGDAGSPVSGGSAGSSSPSGGVGGSSGKGGGNDGGGSGGSSGVGGVGGAVAGDAGRGGTGVAGETASAGESTSAGEGGVGLSSSAGEGSGVGGASAGRGGIGGAASSAPPCDIYAAASVPCVGAYSMVRVLSSAYRGPLYQVRRGGPIPNYNEGGVTQDIGATAYGFGDAAAQDAFCGDEACTVSVLYDQSGKGNHLRSGVQTCYEPSNPARAYEADANRLPLTVGGHDVYALFTLQSEGYRNNEAVDTPEGRAEQGVYVVANGTRSGEGCCWDFGTGTRNNCYGASGSGSANALFLGTGYWGSGQGEGPWFMADLDAGVWAGGTEGSDWINPDSPSIDWPYAFGILKTGPENYALRMGDARSGELTTAWDGGIPMASWAMEGGIILGIGSDVSNSSQGVFYEGVITAGRPSDETDEAVYRNVQAVGYGR
jgi:non-reducing end alpha-L-arabinofuranosidase